jgi:hypothetical protein
MSVEGLSACIETGVTVQEATNVLLEVLVGARA